MKVFIGIVAMNWPSDLSDTYVDENVSVCRMVLKKLLSKTPKIVSNILC